MEESMDRDKQEDEPKVEGKPHHVVGGVLKPDVLSPPVGKVGKVDDPRDKALQPPMPVQTSSASADSPCPSCGNSAPRYRVKSDPPQVRCSACFKPFR
jgi:hypothetical protein